MRYLLRNILAACLLVAGSASWLHSRGHHTRLDLPLLAGQSADIDMWDGRISLSVGALLHAPSPLSIRPATSSVPLWALTHQHEFSAAGFKLAAGDLGALYEWSPPGAGYFGTIVIPLWLPTLIAGIVLAPALWRRRRILSPFGCPTCFYDLRAHKAGDKCPECGTAVSAGLPWAGQTLPQLAPQ